jgi:alkyl sulfatase BDS1-like metallo-beta-lactamase superfamily hydrolase
MTLEHDHDHSHGTKPATDFTTAVNEAALAKYAMDDRDDFYDVDRGFIARVGRQALQRGRPADL